jgi:hypothetical protein
VTTPGSTDPSDLYTEDEAAAGQQSDASFLWLAAGDLPDDETPMRLGGLARLVPDLRREP